ncbi:MAG: site-specific integrase [Chloroflexi bacterium]|nr:site-specific integrase [Chloroflexota bacterium]
MMAEKKQPQAENPQLDVVRAEQPSDAPVLEPPLRAHSTVQEAVGAFEEYMLRKGFSENTIRAFRNDLRFVADYLGREMKLYQVSTVTLENFLPWLEESRGLTFSAKTQARRITTLKVFFGWLHGVGVIGNDPAEPIVHIQARTPLPVIVRDSDVRTLLLKAQDISRNRQEPDARPYLLVSLLVQTGIKKAECARLSIEDLDISQPQAPVLNVRYREERYRHKNRLLGLTATVAPAFQQYLAQYAPQYSPQDLLFDCTPRNLEYVLEDLGELAGIRYVQIGFETLRWTCAVRDFRNGMPEEQLRQKLGLSKISWRETSAKIYELTGR